MSNRDGKRVKIYGKEYWSARPTNRGEDTYVSRHGNKPKKRRTHKAERRLKFTTAFD